MAVFTGIEGSGLLFVNLLRAQNAHFWCYFMSVYEQATSIPIRPVEQKCATGGKT